MITGEEASRMIMIAICGSLIGAVLGIRFKVLVLFPAVLLGFVIVAAVAVLKCSAISSTIEAALVLVISLQIGYLGGLFTRFSMAASRLAFHRSLRSTTARS
jgi:hypothetical protein